MITDKTLIVENPKLKNGFTAMPNSVIMARGLSIGAKLIYGLLIMFAWQENECFPGQERLSVAAEVSIRQVQRYLLELREYGLITWRQRGQNQTNIYYIKDIKTVECLKMPDTTNMSCPDTTCTSYKEDSVKRSVVVEPLPDDEKVSKKEVSSTVENDGAAFDLQPDNTPGINGQELQTDREENPPEEPPAYEQVRANVREVAGTEISVNFAKEIAKNYPPAKIDSALSELRSQVSRGVEIKGVGGWLRYALGNDIQPDQPAKAKVIPERKDANNNRTPRARPQILPNTSYTLTSEQSEKKKALIRSLYV